MKKYVKFSYTEGYLPNPHYSRAQEPDRSSFILVDIKECTKKDAPLAMVVTCPEGEEREIRIYRGLLYRNVQYSEENEDSATHLVLNRNVQNMNWQWYLWGEVTANYCKWSKERGKISSENRIKELASKLLVIDNMVFEETTEPIYNIISFGWKDRMGMFVEYEDEDSKYEFTFSALEREKCHQELKKNLDWCLCKADNSNTCNIKVLMPEYVKFKRAQ